MRRKEANRQADQPPRARERTGWLTGKHAVSVVAYAPRGELLATASYDRTVRLWEVRTGQQIQEFEAHAGWVWGISLSPDEKTLYLVDSCPIIGGNRKIWAFDLSASGEPSNQRVVFDFAPGRGGDGMTVDQKGNLYIAAGISRPRGPHESTDVPPAIWIIRPDGKLLGRLPIPEDTITNVTFGGDDLRTLYVTAGKTLFQSRTTIPGWAVHRKT